MHNGKIFRSVRDNQNSNNARHTSDLKLIYDLVGPKILMTKLFSFIAYVEGVIKKTKIQAEIKRM